MKKKVLLSSIVTIVLCLCLIAGSTFALFTSQDKVGIEVTAANVKMTANISDLTLESVKADPNGTIVDELGGKYSYVGCTDTFINGGTAIFDEETKSLELDLVTPGDRVSFNIQGANESDVIIQYRYVIECIGDALLMGGLNVTIDGIPYPALASYASVWTELQPGQNIDPEFIVIELPVTAGNEYQNQSTSIKVTVEAVQGNADVGENVAPVIEFLAGSNVTAVSDLASLQAALDSAVAGENTIVVRGDIVGDVVATQKPDVKITIEGNGYTFAGSFTVNGQSARYETAGLTIKNVNFEAESVNADAYINLGDESNINNTRYTNNVTVKGCTFSYAGEGDVAAVKSYTGGDYNLTFDGCTVNVGMHSALQVTNVEKGLKIVDCKVYSKNGINLNNTPYLEMSGCTFDTVGYCVRLGVSGGTYNGTYTIANSTLTSANDDGDAVIILRGNMTASTLNLINTELYGSPDITGAAKIEIK